MIKVGSKWKSKFGGGAVFVVDVVPPTVYFEYKNGDKNWMTLSTFEVWFELTTKTGLERAMDKV